MNKSKKLLKLTKYSIYKSFIVTLLFIVVYQLYNVEMVRDKFEDAGFDLTSKWFFSTKEEKAPHAPKVTLFGFDDLYLKKNALFDEDNRTNYGYVFPRSHIAKFIKRFDKVSERLVKYKLQPPKALFVDFDFSFGTLLEGNLSVEDEAFLDLLEAKPNRAYPIVFPKTQTANFIEYSTRPIIQQMIKEKKILFASVGFTIAKDNATRRYVAYRAFHNPTEGNRTYPNVSIVLSKLIAGEDVNVSAIKDEFKEKDIIANRIMFKEYQPNSYKNPLENKQKSYWQDVVFYSAYHHFNGAVDELYEDSVVMVGTNYKNNGDIFEVLASGNSTEMTGMEVHANTLMTLYYFDGQLKALKMWLMILLVFVLVFFLDFGVAYLLFRLNKKENKWTNVAVLVLVLVVMLMVSLLLLKHSLWFNWFIPMILYDLIDVILG